MRRFLSDTFAMVTFSTVVGMMIEVIISGMTFEQSVQARFTAVPVNLITARPYGIFRDWTFQFFKVEKGNQVKKSFVDILAFIIFQVPLYAIILVFSGANIRQIATACTTVTIFSAFMGRPYGIFLDFSRWLFKIKK